MHADAYFNRAISYTESEINKAIEDLTKAIKLNPDDAATYYLFRGQAWLQIGKREKSESDWRLARNLGMESIPDIDKIIEIGKLSASLLREKNIRKGTQ